MSFAPVTPHFYDVITLRFAARKNVAYVLWSGKFDLQARTLGRFKRCHESADQLGPAPFGLAKARGGRVPFILDVTFGERESELRRRRCVCAVALHDVAGGAGDGGIARDVRNRNAGTGAGFFAARPGYPRPPRGAAARPARIRSNACRLP